ncbi:MAG: hypothetical protein ACOYB3_12910 [Azonexus sp.]
MGKTAMDAFGHALDLRFEEALAVLVRAAAAGQQNDAFEEALP